MFHRDSNTRLLGQGLFFEPLQATLEYYDEGYAASIASGDIITAAVNELFGHTACFYAGVKLESTRQKGDQVPPSLHPQHGTTTGRSQAGRRPEARAPTTLEEVGLNRFLLFIVVRIH